MRWLVALLLLLLTGAGAARADRVAGGRHWRLETEHGPVHVWKPRGSRADRAGVVVYVHGYYTSADRAFKEYGLAKQFARSRRDAWFIVPEAPAGGGEEVSWPVLADLLQAVEQGVGQPLPAGPLVAAGHSGAYRTISGWLGDARLGEIILLDGLYGNDEEFFQWATAPGGHRLTLVSNGTRKAAAALVARIPGARRLPRVPRRLAARDREAAVLEMRAQMSHMDIVWGGQVLPLTLGRSRLVIVGR